MKCVICKSPDIQMKNVEEEIKLGKDIILVPIEVLVCNNCGERYYDSRNMKKIENIRLKLGNKELAVDDVGKVLRANVA
ncbi:MAG: YgiT-type zinc finger protein [Ignavibacteriaceae bacterium]